MTDWNKLKVVDLKAELKRRGLAQTGLKPALVARLSTAEQEEGSESEATAPPDAPNPEASSATPLDSTDRNAEPRASSPQPDSVARSEPADQIPTPQQDSMEPSVAQAQTAPAPKPSADVTDSSQPPSQAGDHGSSLPSVEPQEAIEDRQKRKRRSLTPPVSATDAARKRLRADDGVEGPRGEVLTTSSDSAWVERHNAVDAAEVNAESEEVAVDGRGVEPGPTIIDIGKEEVIVENVDGRDRRLSARDEMDVDSKPYIEGMEQEGSPTRQRDSRFKDLFTAPQAAPVTEAPTGRDSGYEMETEPDRIIDPAIHPATSALYIRDFMRPLNQIQLKSHLASLATPSGHSVDEDLITRFYIDLIRTHAFVSFTNTSAAARVRSALHGSTWPEERNRKPLWVDFIPAEKVDDWIDQEQATQAGGRSSAKKWEVVYHNIDDNNPIEATLEESGDQQTTRPTASRQPSIPGPPKVSDPTSAREFDEPPSGPRGTSYGAEEDFPSSFSALDQLFQSTTAKPALYWQPVSKSVANRRLDAIDAVTSKNVSARVPGDINRYSFEEGDVLIDRGPEIFPGIRPPPGYRGPGRGGSRGGFQSRGGRGAYDSYRGGPSSGFAGGGRWDRRDPRDDRRY